MIVIVNILIFRSNKIDNLKDQVGCLESVVAFLIFFGALYLIDEQYRAFKAQCILKNIFITSADIEACTRDKCGF